MKAGATAMAMMLFAVMFIAHSPVPVIAQTHPSLVTDKALYTLRDQQIVLQGEAYVPKAEYVIWLQTPHRQFDPK